MKINIGSIIDGIGKYVSRIKTMAVLIIVVCFLISITQNGCDRKRIEGLTERLTGLNIQNDILQKDIKEKKSVIQEKDKRIRQLQDSIKKMELISNKLKAEKSDLKAKYDDLASRLLKIPADSSYQFLDKVAYPYGGFKEYPFSDPQVKGMHLTFLEKEHLFEINENLESQVSSCETQLAYKDTIYNEAKVMYRAMKDIQVNQDSIIVNKEAQIDIKEKQMKKERLKKRFWQTTTAIAIILAVL